MKKNLFRKSRISEIVALGLSITMLLNPIAASAQGLVRGNSGGRARVLTVSAGDVSPGDVSPGDVSPGDVTPGDVSGGNVLSTYFPDPNLAAAVIKALPTDVTPGDVVTTAQLESIDTITVDAVTNWTGMDKLTSLGTITVLPTVEYDIINLAPLVSYTQFDAIFLGTVNPWDPGYSYNQNIKGDISVFSNMRQLRGLFGFDGTRLSGSLSDLQYLSDLECISLVGDQITGTTSMLKGFDDLGLLSLKNTSVTGTLSDLATLEDLYQLEITGPGIEGNIEVFSGFTDMKHFRMGDNERITGDTSTLANMTDLVFVLIENTSISSTIRDFAKCDLLESLFLWEHVTGKLSDLSEKNKLKELGVSPTVYSTPEDKNLFPNLVDYDSDLFTASVFDTEGSTLTFVKGQSQPEIRLHLGNKSLMQVVDVMVDDTKLTKATEEVLDAEYYHQWDDENYQRGSIVLMANFLETLAAGKHTFTLVIPQGGDLTGTFTISEASVPSHTVTFLDWFGEVIDTVSVIDGAAATAPTVASYEGYTFIGWDKAIDNVTTDLTVKPQYVMNQYTVTFCDWDGTVLDSQLLNYRYAATAPTSPSRTGYTFTGWDKAFDEVTTDLTVTAQYSINQYTVTFRDWDGTVLDTQRITYSEAATAPTSPSRAGYGFTGWDVEFNNVTKDLVVTASYQANMFTVTFVDYNGDKLAQQTVAYGKPAIAPVDPSRQGYEFIGWDKGFASITEDLTVTAKYHLLSGSPYEIKEPGTVDGTTLEDFGDIIIKAEGVTLIGGSFEGNVRVEAAKAILKNITVAGNVYLTAKETTMTDSKVEGSLTASAESITLQKLTIAGNLSIGATNISLLGSTVGGNLTIERSVGNGHVVINDVIAKDTIMYVKGGGSNSVIVKDSKFGAIVVDKVLEKGQEAVRVAVEGKTEVANTIVNSAAIIEDTTEEGSGILSLTLAKEIPNAATVELRGAIQEVTVQKEALMVVNNAQVAKIQVEAPALVLVNNATVAELKVEENVTDVKVEGEKVNNIVLAQGAEEPVFVPRPQSNISSGNDEDMDAKAQTFLPKGADGTANLYGKVSVYEDVLLTNGQKAKAKLLPVSEAIKKAANEFAKTQNTINTPFAYVDVVVDGYKSGKATIKFNLYDIYKNDTIMVFHMLSDGTWESIIPDKIEDGAVTVTFNSLSPVVFSKIATGAAGSAKVSSPKTGDVDLTAMVVMCVLGICVGFGYLQLTRRKNRRYR